MNKQKIIRKFCDIHKHPANLIWVKDYLTHPEETHDMGCKWELKGYYYTITIQNNGFFFDNGTTELTSKSKKKILKEINNLKSTL